MNRIARRIDLRAMTGKPQLQKRQNVIIRRIRPGIVRKCKIKGKLGGNCRLGVARAFELFNDFLKVVDIKLHSTISEARG
jgi:hypothetical protein